MDKFICKKHRYCYCDPKWFVEARLREERKKQELSSIRVGFGLPKTVDDKLEIFMNLRSQWKRIR